MAAPDTIPWTFVFKQEGEKLTGTQSKFGESAEQKITGSVNGNKVAFTVEGKKKRKLIQKHLHRHG